VVLYIQKRGDAFKSYAQILNAKSNTDGYKADGITYPSRSVQAELLREVYAEVEIDPAIVTYVEAHGKIPIFFPAFHPTLHFPPNSYPNFFFTLS